jgi:hypothetical protein
MKKQIFTIALGLAIAGAVNAQEYKVAKSTGTLDIREVNNVSIEGTTGNEIVFISRGYDRDDDGRAKGLRAISAMGLEDNTGIGLSVIDKGTVIEVQQLKKMDGPDITIKVPKGVKISYTHTSPYGDEIEIKNFDGEIEVSTVHNGVVLTNDGGPMDIRTVHGDIDASLNAASMKSPISLESVHGHVDAALPVSTKADLRLSTQWGEIFVDPDFKIEIENKNGLVKYNDRVTGKINGGGLNIDLSSTHNSVYLRKK